MQNARYVGRRYHDGERLLIGVGFRMKQVVVLPVIVPFGFYVVGTVSFGYAHIVDKEIAFGGGAESYGFV